MLLPAYVKLGTYLGKGSGFFPKSEEGGRVGTILASHPMKKEC